VGVTVEERCSGVCGSGQGSLERRRGVYVMGLENINRFLDFKVERMKFRDDCVCMLATE